LWPDHLVPACAEAAVLAACSAAQQRKGGKRMFFYISGNLEFCVVKSWRKVISCRN
jgi:hypothetical protein